MNCAIIVICLGFLCLQYIDCVNCYSTCLDYNCTDYTTSYTSPRIFWNNACVDSCRQDDSTLRNTLYENCTDICLQDYNNYTNNSPSYTFYVSCADSCWQDYNSTNYTHTLWYTLYYTCKGSCRQDYINSTNSNPWNTYYTCKGSCRQDYINTLDYTCEEMNCLFTCYCPVDHGIVAFNVVMLLAVVLPVIAVNTALLVALVLESSIVKVIRLALASILISCLLTALGLVMYHIAGIVHTLSPVNYPPGLDPVPCTITLFLIIFGGAARLVFMATFAIVVYIIVKHGEATKKHIVVAVLVTVAVLWVATFLGTSPWLSQEVVITGYDHLLHCAPGFILYGYIYEGLFVFFFCVVAPSLAVIILLIICCKKHSPTSYTSVEKTIVKFGFFLLLGNGLNVIGLAVPAIIAGTGQVYVIEDLERAPERTATLIYAAFTLVNAGLIPTPIFILIFFKSIRKRLLYWLCCCCMAKKRKAKRNRKNNNNVEGCMVTTEV